MASKPNLLCKICWIFLIVINGLCGEKSEKRNVLVLPIQQKSHLFMMQPISEELVQRGHNVYTVLGSQFGPLVQKKLEKVGIKILWYEQTGNLNGANIDQFIAKNVLDDRVDMRNAMQNLAVKVMNDDCNDMWADQQFLKKIKAITFDVAFLEAFLFAPCNILLAHNHSIPFVSGNVANWPWGFGQPSLPSVEPLLIFDYTYDMSFWQRINNYITSVALTIDISDRLGLRSDVQLRQTYAPLESSYQSIMNKALLCIVYRDFITEWPSVTMPHILTLPGISYSDAKPLPQDLKKLMDASKEVVVVSFGSMGGLMPEKHMHKFISAFRKMKQTVMLSFSGDTHAYEPIPKNLHIFKWLPQNDILGHENTKLFITHGGHNGQTEAIYHGVPMIVIPLYAEQHHNAFRAVHHGLGLQLDLFDFTSGDLVNHVQAIFENQSYSVNAALRSKMLKELPFGKAPAKLAADWIEYVTNNGADHMRSSAIGMPFIKKYSIDVIIFLLFAIFLVISLVLVTGRYLARFICRRTRKVKSN